MTTQNTCGHRPLYPTTFGIPDGVAPLLAAGCRVTYADDPAWPGSLYADLRDAAGRIVDCGSGATRAEARADLARRLARPETAARAAAMTAAAPAPREDLADGDRTDMIGVMTPDERMELLAHIAGYTPAVFDAAVASRSQTFAAELLERVDAKLAEEAANDPEGYCTVCGANVAWFIGCEGPQHFRGPHTLVTGSERRELFTPDDGHAPAVAWRYPDGPTGLKEA